MNNINKRPRNVGKSKEDNALLSDLIRAPSCPLVGISLCILSLGRLQIEIAIQLIADHFQIAA